jgi:hypothetical protein
VSSTSVALHATHPWSSFFCCVRAMFISSKNLFSRYQKNPSFQFKQKLLYKTHLTKLQNQRARRERVSRAWEKAEKVPPPSLWCYLPIINLPITYLLTYILPTYLSLSLFTYLPLTWRLTIPSLAMTVLVRILTSNIKAVPSSCHGPVLFEILFVSCRILQKQFGRIIEVVFQKVVFLCVTVVWIPSVLELWLTSLRLVDFVEEMF